MDLSGIDFSFTAVLAAFLVLLDFVIRVLSLIYVPRNRRPQTAMAWLLAIFFIPYVGILLFLIFGSRKLPKGRRDKQSEINQFILESTEGMDQVKQDQPWPLWLAPVVELNRTLGAMPLVGGNSATLYSDYQESLEAMTAAVNDANNYVHVEFYILSLDPTTAPFFDALEAAHNRGVRVRVLLDHLASLRAPGYLTTIRRLKKIGLQWEVMLPLQPLKWKFQRPDLRNHRKLLVIDNKLAFTGSQNMVDSTYNKRVNKKRGLQWKDLMVRFEGPIVAGIHALFITDWYSETNELLVREASLAPPTATTTSLDAQVVPSGPGFEGENNLRLFNSLLYAAQERVIITSPYFVPDDSMLYAITTAAQSGLDVQLFVSEVGDQALVYHAQRSYYETLLRAGVRIWLYPTPTVLHAKHFTIDDQVAVIGSSNMDMRSFSLNLEISVMVRGPEFIAEMRELESEYRGVSRELTLEEWMERPRRSKVLDNLARLTAAVQ
ncbi:cardiolipin synthase [Salinibacterium sp. NSLL150]|uniref:cardiolipin synthase n=1 Tax=unclassified Salinibacterium TaxID=2632331 RepID=UPI0018CD6235|nr:MULTISPECIES: cardiolipin synthase [unclassified Salinibacterium]MBH0099931.1 cardiolipin synthase [Salinibacterium sp. NSLL35]MBH0102685.1 cardiolipin synthase [Salinibacterium sp. NSLL150]MBH0105445.1 cardiolipin synthase [Salinibacterium sp. NSLL16]MBH0108205.1 cardiolipin synthase [Salinibacterium sp. NSLL17]